MRIKWNNVSKGLNLFISIMRRGIRVMAVAVIAGKGIVEAVGTCGGNGGKGRDFDHER